MKKEKVTMSNEEAMLWLVSLAEHEGEEVLISAEDAKALQMGIDAIKALEQTRWVPVSERPPEEEGLYIVSVKNDHDRRYSKTCWFHGNGNWFSRQDVEAWMPLPEPYKTESEDEE